MKKSVYFHLSGEHPTLPKAEIKSIMEAETYSFDVMGQFPQLLRMMAPYEALQSISDRSSMCKSCGPEILFCDANLKLILNLLKEVDMSRYIMPDENFSVRITRVNDFSRNLKTPDIERDVGGFIKNSVKNTKVDLTNPTKQFFGLLTGEKFLLGLHFFGKLDLAARQPKMRPVFHPSTMEPKLARCMVNLARAKKGRLFLDPFCGIGGILIEAGLMGCDIIGCDRDLRMVKGTIQNLKHYNLDHGGVISADARKNPFIPIKNIATDPPYGKNSSSLGTELESLFRDALSSAFDSLIPTGVISVSSPKGAKLKEYGEETGLKLKETHDLYVHRSLTREILVFER
ncbi:MAG: THUMP domain-containing protein [Candidatus Bathyarchaeota archaeon]|nr:THUMP domain-containing protein [Candidatus Bathyarchaeota archaeon]